MSLYVKLSMQEIADGLTAIGWSGAGGGGDASLSYGSTAPLAPTNGTLWYDTTEEILKLFRVDTWVDINVTQSVINNINAQVTLAQTYAQDAQEALAEFTSIVATATTLAPESSATATFNASTGVLTLGIPKGAQGVQGIQGIAGADGAVMSVAGRTGDVTLTTADIGGLDAALASVQTTMINKPTIASPSNGTIDYIGSITASSFSTSDTYNGNHDYTKWELSLTSDFSSVLISSVVGNLTSWTPSIGLALTQVYVRFRFGSDGHLSNWSDTLSFTTPNIYIQTPTLTVTGTPSDVTETPTLTTSAFSVYNGSDTHVSTDWVVTQGGTEVWSSMADTSNKTSIVVPAGELVVNTAYVFKARHNGSTYGASGWVEVSGTTKASFSIQYGLQWNNTADTYTRLGAAASWTTGADFTNNETVQSRMRRCVLNANGTVNYYLSATDSTKKADGVTAADLTGASGNVMVEIPKFYCKYDNTTGAKQMWISTAPKSGYVVHPAWVKNGVEVDYRYYRAYKGSVNGSKLISRSGVAAAGNETIVSFRTKAQANETGWGLVDWHLLFAVQTLLFIEIGTFNSQSILGNGNDTGSDSGMTTGGSNSIGNASSPSTNDDTWMSYRGIENFYADIFEWIDGINISERLVYTSNTQSTFASDVFSGAYTSTGITLPSGGYISDMNFSTKGFIPTVSAGSASTYVTDYVNSSTGARVAAFGGYVGSGLSCGAAFLNANYGTSSIANATLGAGLSF